MRGGAGGERTSHQLSPPGAAAGNGWLFTLHPQQPFMSPRANQHHLLLFRVRGARPRLLHCRGGTMPMYGWEGGKDGEPGGGRKRGEEGRRMGQGKTEGEGRRMSKKGTREGS